MNISELANPISEDMPFGIYLKNERKIYRPLRSTLNKCLSAYRALSETAETMLDEELQLANATAWQELNSLTFETLKETTKDLEIFCWFVASCVHLQNPFENLAEGFAILANFVDDAWEEINPQAKKEADADELTLQKEATDLKLRAFLQLFGEVENSGLLFSPMNNIEIIPGLTYASFVSAQSSDSVDQLKNEFKTQLNNLSDDVAQTYGQLCNIEKSLERLTEKLNVEAFKVGLTPPNEKFVKAPTTNMINMLELLAEGTSLTLQRKADIVVDESHAKDADQSAQTDEGVDLNEGAISTSQVNRDEAILALVELCDYFRKTEPHSPIYLLLERAIRWSQLSFTDLYRELLTEESTAFKGLSTASGLESDGYSKTLYKNVGQTGNFYLKNFSKFQNLIAYSGNTAVNQGAEINQDGTAAVQSYEDFPSEVKINISENVQPIKTAEQLLEESEIREKAQHTADQENLSEADTPDESIAENNEGPQADNPLEDFSW